MVKKSASKKPKNGIKIRFTSVNKHVFMLYALLIFTWITMLSMFIETTGSFVINFRATFFGLLIGLGAASLIYNADKNLR